VSIFVQFNAVELFWRDRGVKTPGAQFIRKVDHLVCQIEEELQGDVEEIPAAAGGVQHPDGGDFIGEGAQEIADLLSRPGAFFSILAFRIGLELVYFGLDPFPLSAQGRHQHRFHDQQNVSLAGVVRSQLAALGRVEAALEQRPKDGWLHLPPIQRIDLGNDVQRFAIQFEHLVVIE